ncbi:MAG: DUF637 domain-containing protein [Thiobacillus sp.]|nr:DUF637 domain-containing protein [Thiobacillus sp.]
MRTAIETLSQKPGQGYLKELGNRSDIDWQRVEELNKSLDFSKSCLTQEATIVVIIVVSILTYGAATSAGGAAATAVGASSTGAVAAGFTAGLSSLASTAAVSLINNKGDIGAVLKELGSSENAKGLLLTMATAGLTQGILSQAGLSNVNAQSSVGQLLAKNTIQGITSAVMESAVMGTSLEDAIKSNLQGALINTVAAQGAVEIGDAKLDATSKALAHALLGCAMGAATAGSSSGCAPGATGAVIGEIVAGLYADASGYDQLKIDANKPGASAELQQQLAVVTNTMTELAKLTGAGGALLIGGDAETMQTATTTAQNAAVNNRQLHADERAWILNHADEFARSQGISRETAIARLSQQASRNVDLGYRARLSDGDDVAAQAFLGKPNATFTNDAGQAQTLFTTQDQQLLRPEMFADQVDVRFVQQYVAPGFTRSLEQGLNKELRDLGVDTAIGIKNGVIDLGAAIKDHPGAVVNAVWEGIKGLPEAIWSGTQEAGRSLGEGAAVALNPDLQQKLNELYQTDTRSAQMLLETARVVTALGAASGAAKTVDTFAEALNKGVAKKLDEIAASKASAQAQAAARVENNANAENDGWSNKPSGLNETTPVKDTFGKAPNDSDLVTHLSTGGPSAKNVYGAHAEAAYRAELTKIGGTEIGKAREIAPGIWEHWYNTPDRIVAGKAPLPKTTYDARWSDQQIVDMSKQASSQVWTDIQKTGVIPQRPIDVQINGVPFKVLVGRDANGNVTSIYSHPGKS